MAVSLATVPVSYTDPVTRAIGIKGIDAFCRLVEQCAERTGRKEIEIIGHVARQIIAAHHKQSGSRLCTLALSPMTPSAETEQANRPTRQDH